MCLLFNMQSRLVITFLPRSNCLLISWLQSPSAVILEPRKIKSATVSPSICHEVILLMLTVFKNIGKPWKVFRHWGERMRCGGYNNHSCYCRTDCRAALQRTRREQPRWARELCFPDNRALTAKSWACRFLFIYYLNACSANRGTINHMQEMENSWIQ